MVESLVLVLTWHWYLPASSWLTFLISSCQVWPPGETVTSSRGSELKTRPPTLRTDMSGSRSQETRWWLANPARVHWRKAVPASTTDTESAVARNSGRSDSSRLGGGRNTGRWGVGSGGTVTTSLTLNTCRLSRRSSRVAITSWRASSLWMIVSRACRVTDFHWLLLSHLNVRDIFCHFLSRRNVLSYLPS